MAQRQSLQPIYFRLLTLLAEDGYTQEQLSDIRYFLANPKKLPY